MNSGLLSVSLITSRIPPLRGRILEGKEKRKREKWEESEQEVERKGRVKSEKEVQGDE